MDTVTLKKLLTEVALQNGDTGSDEDFKRIEEAERKVVWRHGADFGSPVEIHWKGDGEFEGDVEYGYLMGLPGAISVDMDGVVHVPHPVGEKCEGDPVWMAYTAIAALPDCEKVIIGEEKANA